MRIGVYLIILAIMTILTSCTGYYYEDYEDYEERARRNEREREQELLDQIARDYDNATYYFIERQFMKSESSFNEVLKSRKFDKYFYSDSVQNFLKQNLNFAIENKGLQFAEKFAKQFYWNDYLQKIDSIKTAKQDSIDAVKRDIEKKDRKWVFYDAGYYEMISDPEFQYTGTDYIYLWYDENSIMKTGNFIHVMTKFSYKSSGNCPTYQFFKYNVQTGERTTIDLYHSCLEIYTGVHNWEMGKIGEEFFNLLISKLE